MQFTAVFEHWHLGDGNYPVLAVGDEARLSFELDVSAAEPVGPAEEDRIHCIRDAEYEVIGQVIRQYADGISSTFPVVQAGWLRFYCPTSSTASLAVGARVRLRGRLALDHCQWVEFLDRYADPPDLFYGVRVMRVRHVSIPERSISRSGRGMAYPTALEPGDYGPEQVRDVSAVGEEADGPAFSLLDLEVLPSGSGPSRPTFLCAHDVQPSTAADRGPG